VDKQAPVNLQREWDRLLIDKFYGADTLKMYILCMIFKRNFGITDDQFDELKRIPKLIGHRNVYARRFICAYLPKIADILWKHKHEEIETLADAMSKISYDVDKVESDYNKINRDRNEITRSKKANFAAALSKKESNKWHKSINLGKTWNVTK